MAPPVADVDDTASFMAAARSFKMQKEYGKPPAPSEDASTEQLEDASHFPFDAPNADEAPVEPSSDAFNGTLSLILFWLGKHR